MQFSTEASERKGQIYLQQLKEAQSKIVKLKAKLGQKKAEIEGLRLSNGKLKAGYDNLEGLLTSLKTA